MKMAMKQINADRVDYIRELFRSVSEIGARGRRERRLRALCEKVAGVSNPPFLTTEWAAKIILELNARRHKNLERRSAQKRFCSTVSRLVKERF